MAMKNQIIILKLDLVLYRQLMLMEHPPIISNSWIWKSFLLLQGKHLHEKAAEFDIGILVVLKAAIRLLSVIKLINQAVGDALSCLLSVEAILQQKGQSCRQNSCPAATTNAETVAIRPPGIQEAIDAETVKYPKGRCFIRPSGTKDVIRVYAEASTQEATDSLAKSVAKIVDRFLGFGTSRQ
ncbi:hypothetical protein GOBAR_AA15103 [Gossypium barbadense]|uniref:Uncharacterized protein n=1 Tax=Gossypium barbadense TaxID=3634 RepID=A0A2P5XQD6_GOSBA|nr:hypothetical protein GOBAR_AA15103 [Gossypium barbadense]